MPAPDHFGVDLSQSTGPTQVSGRILAHLALAAVSRYISAEFPDNGASGAR